MSLWDDVQSVAEKIGNVSKMTPVVAVPGMVLDMAQLGGDVIDQLPGSWETPWSQGTAGSHGMQLANQFGNLTAPLTFGQSDKAWWGVKKAVKYSGYGWDQMQQTGATLGTMSAVSGIGPMFVYRDPTYLKNFGELFDRHAWHKAWDVGEDRTTGQSILLSAATDQIDPLDPTAWNQFKEHEGIRADVASGAIDFAASWYADPLVLGGKAIKISKMALTARPMAEEDLLNLSGKIDLDKAKLAGVPGLGKRPTRAIGTRFERMFGHVDDETGTYVPGLHDGPKGITGTGEAVEPLNGQQMLQLHPELKHAGMLGPEVAGLLAKAAKIKDPAARLNESRLIYRMISGDTTALDEIAARIERNQAISGEALKVDSLDQADLYSLANMVKGVVSQPELGPVLDTETMRYFDTLDVNDSLASQADAVIDKDHLLSVQDLLDGQLDQLKQLRETFGTASKDTLRVSSAGKRALARSENTGFLREMPFGKVKNPSKEFLGNAQVAERFRNGSTVYQKGFFSVAARTWAYPSKLTDSFRNFMPPQWVNLNDTPELVQGVESMLRHAGMSAEQRSPLVAAITEAVNVPERRAAVEAAESSVRRHLTERYLPEDANVDDVHSLLETIEARGMSKRRNWQKKTQVFSSANHPDNPNYHADHYIPDDGQVVITPLSEAQEADKLPLIDVDMLRTELKRNSKQIAHFGNEWGKLNRMPLTTPRDVVHEAHVASMHKMADSLIDATDVFMRTWKFAALFRPVAMSSRNIFEGRARMMAALGTFGRMSKHLDAGVRNEGYNIFSRRGDVRNQLAALNMETNVLSDHLAGMRHDFLDEVEKKLNGYNKIIANHEAGKVTYADERVQQAYRNRTVLTNANPDVFRRIELRDRIQELGDQYRVLDQARAKGPEYRRYMLKNDINLPGGYRGWGFAGGPYGDMYLGESSASDALNRLYWGSHGEEMKGYQSGADWVSRSPTDTPAMEHLGYWHNATNKHLAHDPLTKVYLRGGRDEEGEKAMVEWLTRSAEGRNHAKKFPTWSQDVKQWARAYRAQVEHYVPRDANVERQILDRSSVTQSALANAVPNVMQRPVVHAPSLDSTTGTGNLSWLQKMAQGYFEQMVARPETAFVRHPFIEISYDRKYSDLVKKALAQKGHVTPDDLALMHRVARGHALNEMRRTLFDVASHSEVAHFMRFASPFFMAWQDTMTKWARILYNDPSVAARFMQVFDAPRKQGWVTDQDGNPVAPGEPINDEHVINIPGLDNVMGVSLPINESSLNLVLQGGGATNPGGGPLLQIPASYFSKKFAGTDPKADSDFAAILPFDAPTSTWKQVMPAYMQRAYSYFFHDDSYMKLQAQMIQAQTVDFEKQYHRPPNAQEQRKLVERVESQTRKVSVMRFMMNFMAPFPPIPDSRYAVQVHTFRRLQQQGIDEGRPYNWASEQFIEKMGPSFFPLTQSTSNNIGNLLSNTGTVAALKQNRALANSVDPQIWRVIIGPHSKGAYNQLSHTWLSANQAIPGEPESYFDYQHPADANRAMIVNQGWSDYTKLLHAMNVRAHALGLTSYAQDADLLAQKVRLTTALGKKNPIWEQDFYTFNDKEYDATIEDLRKVAYNPKLVGDTARSDIPVLQRYLKIRDNYAKILKSRDAAGGSDDPDAVANQDIMLQYTQAVTGLMASNTYFQDYIWSGLVERDPMLVDTTTDSSAAPLSAAPSPYAGAVL